MPRYLLSAGHGGTDPGSTYHNTTERDEMIRVVDACFELLKSQNLKNFTLTRVPHNLGLIDGVKWINANCDPANDLTIEVHMNANSGTPGTGIEAYYGYKPLADALYKAAVRFTGLRGRHDGHAHHITHGDPIMDGKENPNYLHFNRETKCRSALLELGFINNLVDLTVVREKGARALAEGILEAVGSAWVDPAPVEPLFRVFDENAKQVGAYKVYANAVSKLINDLDYNGYIQLEDGTIKTIDKPVPVPVEPPVTPVEPPKPIEPTITPTVPIPATPPESEVIPVLDPKSPSFKSLRAAIFGGVAAVLVAVAQFVGGSLTDPNFVYDPALFVTAVCGVAINALMVYVKNI